MRIAVFGAAGRTGREVVRQALARGHEVTAFVRDAGHLGVDGDPALRIVSGDARDRAAVDDALAGADAAISVMSLASAEREPELSDATGVVVDAAGDAGVGRVVVTANNDVLTEGEVTGGFAAHAREHRRNRALLGSSDLRWTIGAAPWVTDDAPTGGYRVELDGKAPGRRLAPGDLATFTLDALDRDDWVGRVVGVSA